MTAVRQVFCRYGDIDEIRWVFKGLPQGSVLSPILYALYVSDLELCCVPGCNILEYADNVVIFSDVYPVRDGLRVIEQTASHIIATLDKIGLCMSASKSKLCIFSYLDNDLKDHRRTINRNKYSIKIGDNRIYTSSSVKFLGVYLQSNLTWGKQIRHIQTGCQIPLRIIKYLRHTWWGADPRLLISIYKALIRSRLEYRGFLFSNLTLTQRTVLDRIQFRALRWALGCRMSTPTNIILVEAREPPLHLRWLYLSKCFLTKACTTRNHPLWGILTNLQELEEDPTIVTFWNKPIHLHSFEKLETVIHLLHSDSIPIYYSKNYESLHYHPDVHIDDGRFLQNASCADQLFHSVFEHEISTSTCLFTDGSKIPGTSFTGFAITTENESIKLLFRACEFLSSFTLEVMAILEAVRFCDSANSHNFTILSDSRAVLSALNSRFAPNKTSCLILVIKDLLRKIDNEGKTIKLIWIPGHTQIKGNEMADLLAKEAISKGIDTQISVPFGEFKNLWKAQLFEELHDWYRNTGKEKGIFYFTNYYHNGRRSWIDRSHISRKSMVSLIRLRSGHTALGRAASLFRFRIVNSPLCPACGVDETPNHVFWNCKRFQVLSDSLLTSICKIRGLSPHPVEYLLATLEPKILLPLCSFIDSANLYI